MHYAVRKRTDFIDPKRPFKYYPYPKYTGKITLRELAKDIALASSLTRGDVESVILNMIDTMTFYLKEGNSVQLDEFCTLRLSFNAAGSDREEEADHRKIKKTKLVFTAGKGLRRELQNVSYKRVKK